MPSLHLASAPVPSNVRTKQLPDLWPSPPLDSLPALRPQPDAFGESQAPKVAPPSDPATKQAVEL